MKITCKLELTVEVDEENAAAVIADARRVYLEHGGINYVSADDEAEVVTAEDQVSDLPSAILELVQWCPLLNFDNGPIRFVEGSCYPVESSQEADDEPAVEQEPDDDDLDGWQGPCYVCRWPNGEFTVVVANSKRDAIIMLDELGPADPEYLYPLDEFMADFRLTDSGDIELNEFGEAAASAIWENCYPELDDLLDTDMTARQMKKAVQHERTRLWDQPARKASTEFGQVLAEQAGASAVVADHYVEASAKKFLKSSKQKGKPS